MKKYVTLLGCIIFATVAYAQGVTRGVKVLEGAPKGLTRKVSVGKQPTVKPIPNGSVGAAATSAALNVTRTGASKANTAAPSKTGKTGAKSPAQQAQDNITAGIGAYTGNVTEWDPKEHTPLAGDLDASITELERRKKGLQEENKAGKAAIDAGKTFADFGKSVLLAPVPIGTVENPAGFSMTVIKTTYNGQEEIFGVIPSHALVDTSHAGGLADPGLIAGKIFDVQIKDHLGRDRMYEAEVVQFSPASLLDISIVKFLDPMAELEVKPLELSPISAILNEPLFSYGYANGRPHSPIQRTVQAISLLSVRTDQNLQGERAGFCGSPLLDSNGKVKAIHTGTLEMPGDIPDISYGTHAKFVQLLIDAYHNDGKAMYDLEIDGQTLAHLNVDEYISALAIYDSNGKLIHQKNLTEGRNSFSKFSESELRKLLNDLPDATYLMLRIRHSQWNATGTHIEPIRVPKNPGKKGKMIDPTKRENWYNLQTRQIEPERPAIIKM